MYSCGLRVSEVVGLRISCIDEVEGMVKVIGKGNKERIIPIGEVALDTSAPLRRPVPQVCGHRNLDTRTPCFLDAAGAVS